MMAKDFFAVSHCSVAALTAERICTAGKCLFRGGRNSEDAVPSHICDKERLEALDPGSMALGYRGRKVVRG